MLLDVEIVENRLHIDINVYTYFYPNLFSFMLTWYSCSGVLLILCMYTEGFNLCQSLRSVNLGHLIGLPKVWHFGIWKLELHCGSFEPPPFPL